MTKYTKDALINYLINIIIAVSTGMVLALSATIFGMDKVIYGLAIVVFFYCSYKYVKIQAEINERLDRLNNK
jgi:ABC-type uncharacterized transport system permease subunit